jgi:hypothetical protein
MAEESESDRIMDGSVAFVCLEITTWSVTTNAYYRKRLIRRQLFARESCEFTSFI